jgi:hypothetical protein
VHLQKDDMSLREVHGTKMKYDIGCYVHCLSSWDNVYRMSYQINISLYQLFLYSCSIVISLLGKIMTSYNIQLGLDYLGDD